MKKLTIFIFLIVQFFYLYADPIDSITALTVAQRFIEIRRPNPNSILNVLSENHNGQLSYYVVNFKEGGWVMVSAYKSTIPVLSYSLIGTYALEDQKPDAFTDLVKSYKKSISISIENSSTNNISQSKWDELLIESNLKSSYAYTPGNQLLDVSGRGHVQWNQSYNWDAGCSPRYNTFYPDNNCANCDNTPTGCGPVAMGQIMWYWEWPKRSTFRTYDWFMPPIISSSTSQSDADLVARLLYDCDIVNVWRTCPGTMATLNNIEDAFHEDFGYETAKKYIKNDWTFGTAWEDLLRSEIDNGRPVLYRGDSADLSTHKHIFVLDGYDSSDPDYFWFNFGWGYYGDTAYNTSRHYLSDISPDDHHYTENQMAIVGISPTYPEMEVNIYDLDYPSVYGVITEDAQQNIAIPSDGETLTVYANGEYILTAGLSVTLKPGFSAKLGSKLKVDVDPNYQEEKDITVSAWTNYFNNELGYNVDNSNSWEFIAYNGIGQVIFQSAGSILTAGTVYVWDGSGATRGQYYTCYIRFKNNFGRELDHSYQVYYSY